MAPRGKRAKTKAPTVVDALSTEEMNKDQLEEHIVRLREELDREREEKSFFQLERDRIQSLWETSLRDLDQVQTELNQSRREMEEAEERHRMEINVYKQKLKHVLSEQHGAVSELKLDTRWSQIQDQDQGLDQGTRRELHLVQETSRLQETLRDQKHRTETSQRDLQLKQQVSLMELMNDYDRKVRDMEQMFRSLSLSLTQQQEKRIQQEVQQVQEEASRRSSELKQEQKRLLMVTEQHYSSLRRRLEQEQKELTDQQQELREELSRVHKKLTTSQKENLCLKETLEEAQREVPELRRRVELKEEDKRKEKVIGQKQKVVEQQLRALKTEKTLLQQAFRQVQRERDQLKDSHLELELQLQRKNGLKEALLSHKLRELQTSLNQV